MVCPKCSHWINLPADACPGCGRALVPAQTAPPPEPFPQQVAPEPSPTSPANQLGTWVTKENIALTRKVAIGIAVLVVGLFSLRFAVAHPFITTGLVLFAGLVVASLPKRCYICSNTLTKHVFEWRLDGKYRRVCSHCNTSLSRQNSRDAMRRHNARAR